MIGNIVGGKWSSDVNLNIDDLEVLHKEFENTIQFMKSSGDNEDETSFAADLIKSKEKILEDIIFIDPNKKISLC